MYIAGALALLFVALITVSALLIHIKNLSVQIGKLETEAVTLSTQLESFDRSTCDSQYTITGANTLTKYTIESAGYVRTYQVRTPHNYDPSVRYPVVVSFDGIEGSGNRMQAYSGLDILPAIIVYPDSIPGNQGFTAWQGAPYSLDGDYDVHFTRAVLDALPSQYCTDSTKVFAVGMSNGGGFAVIAGCKLGDRIHAVASVSGAYYQSCAREERTPSFLVLHSVSDKQVPLTGAVDRKLPAVPLLVEEQAKDRQCETKLPAVSTETVTTYDWLDCQDDSLLRLVVLSDQPHGWLQVPPTSLDIQTTASYIWKFFKDSMYFNKQ